MGAIVTAYDVRAATKEQVESLGGKFLIVDEEAMKEAETSGGYAKEMTEDYKNFGSIVKYNKERIESEYLVYSKNSPQSAGSKKTKKRKKQKFKNNSKKKKIQKKQIQ